MLKGVHVTARGQSTVRSGKAALGAAFVARGLAGSTAGPRKSPGLLGSIMLTLIGGLFFGVGVYVNTHAADLAAKPGNSGSPTLLGWGFLGIGGLVLLVGAVTLLSRLAALIIGSYLLISGRFERTDVPPPAAPAAPHATAPTASAAAFATGWQTPSQTSESAEPPGGRATPAPLVPPPLDPRLPGPAGRPRV